MKCRTGGGAAVEMRGWELFLSGLQRLVEAGLGFRRKGASARFPLPFQLVWVPAEGLADEQELVPVSLAPLADQ
jgi:hypothetical protein